MLHYTKEAKDLIDLLKDFDIKDFEKVFCTRPILIGSQNVLQYVEEKNRWNNKCKIITGEKMILDLSQQAKDVMTYIKDIDIHDLKRWFINSFTIQKANIVDYLTYKNKLNRGKKDG